MKVDYQKTIDGLKERGLINEGDKYAVCVFAPESKSNGVIETVITSKFDYIMVANEEEVKLLDIDQNTGEYLEHGCTFKKSDLVVEKKNKNWIYASRGIFGERVIGIRADYADKFNHQYVLCKKMHGYEQKAAVIDMYTFIKQVYNAHQKEQKTLYKQSKKNK